MTTLCGPQRELAAADTRTDDQQLLGRVRLGVFFFQIFLAHVVVEQAFTGLITEHICEAALIAGDAAPNGVFLSGLSLFRPIGISN